MTFKAVDMIADFNDDRGQCGLGVTFYNELEDRRYRQAVMFKSNKPSDIAAGLHILAEWIQDNYTYGGEKI